jgi:K(+)-stimulated pyrophosphate-energized sodium pump
VNTLYYAVPAAGALALVYAFIKASWVKKQDAGTDEMKDIASQIQAGAMAFIKAEYKVIALFVVFVAGLLFFANSGGRGGDSASAWIAVAFVTGATASALAGFIGMKVATDANVRTTQAATKSLPEALNVAFSGGAVMGMTVVGLALIGFGGLFILFYGMFDGDLSKVLPPLTGFSMGASSIALFARVGGGIYTKAADMGADLVGKVEAGLPEDDPRNPAVIADNVGDNVGDVAGMGADLFESYIGALIGAMILGLAYGTKFPGADGDISYAVLLPLMIAAAGVICSIAGTFLVRVKEGGNPQHALDAGAFGAAGVMAVATFFLANKFWQGAGEVTANDVGIATVIGLATGVLVGLITSYYCSMDKPPVDGVAEQSKTGSATNIVAGLGLGMESTAVPVLLIAAGVIGANHFAGLYGVAIAALGMLSTTGIQLAVDAYGPVADNAGGIAEMTHQDPIVRARTDELDAVGNTTAAIGKGFAIASAAMTALALFAAFKMTANVTTIDVSTPLVMAGLFVGAMLPFLFSSMAMKAVGEAAMAMIEEVRRQFREIPGLLEGTAKPEVEKCVAISTDAAISSMMLPGALAILTPVAVGFFAGPEALGGLLAGVTVSGVSMAIFMSNAGGAWDNAKKSFEGGGYTSKLDGTVYAKGSEAHNAAVVGDTVGDPFKDTAGPSLNILVKLMSVVALVIAPLIANPAQGATEASADIENPCAVDASTADIENPCAEETAGEEVADDAAENPCAVDVSTDDAAEKETPPEPQDN